MPVPENYIAYGTPLFVLAVGIEAAVGRKRGFYRTATGLADLGVGIVGVVADVFLRLLGLGAYIWVYEQLRVSSFEPGNPWSWVLGIVGVDFIYYWWHRLSHGMNMLWAVHAVHHQSEDFNYAVALRQPALEAVSVLVFFLPLALAGVHPVVYAASWAINLFYQFWIHTELIRRLGPLEWVLNTPSHHRVHHGINPEYLDKNYGGILIVWDRLFGSFQNERQPAVYGVTKPLESYNPVWANIEPWAVLMRRVRQADRTSDKLRALVAHPAWRPAAPPDLPSDVRRDAIEKYDPHPPASLRGYVTAHFGLTLALLGLFAGAERLGGPIGSALLGAIVVMSIAAVTGFLESRPWALGLDRGRQLACLGALAVVLAPALPLWAVTATVGAVAAVFVALYVRYRPAAVIR